MAKGIGQGNPTTSTFTSSKSVYKRRALCKSAVPSLLPVSLDVAQVYSVSNTQSYRGSILNSPGPLTHSSTRASLQGSGTGTSSLLRTWEKSLTLLPPGADCVFGKLWLKGPGVLVKANMQVEDMKRNFCHSLYEEDSSQTRSRLTVL